MKNNEQLTTVELMDMIASSLREMSSMDITDRRLPNAINRAKATAMGSQAAMKLAIFHSKNHASEVAGKSNNILTKETKDGKVKMIK